MQNLVARIKFTLEYSQSANLEIWLGGLFDPFGFLTATRQHICRKLALPLENMEITMSSGPIPQKDDNAFLVNGMIGNTLMIRHENSRWNIIFGCNRTCIRF